MKVLILITSLFLSAVVFSADFNDLARNSDIYSAVVVSADFDDLARSSDSEPPKCEEPEIPQAFIDEAVTFINEESTENYQLVDMLQKMDEQEAFAVLGALPFDQSMGAFVLKIKRAYEARLSKLNATPKNKAIFINLMNSYKNLDKPTIESEKGSEEFGAITKQFVKAFGAEYYYTKIHGWGYNAGRTWGYGGGVPFNDQLKAGSICNCTQFSGCRCNYQRCRPNNNSCFPRRCTGKCGWW